MTLENAEGAAPLRPTSGAEPPPATARNDQDVALISRVFSGELPRLPDRSDYEPLDPAVFEALSLEEQEWCYAFGWLPVGWCVAPPRFVPAEDRWLVVAYNTWGCVHLRYVVSAWSARTEAISMLGTNFELYEEGDCGRAQHRWLN